MGVSCAGFKEAPLEAPLFPIGGKIYIYTAGRSPSTALPCFSCRFFPFFSFWFTWFQKKMMPSSSPDFNFSEHFFQLRLKSSTHASVQTQGCGILCPPVESFSRSSAHIEPAEGSQSQSNSKRHQWRRRCSQSQ